MASAADIRSVSFFPSVFHPSDPAHRSYEWICRSTHDEHQIHISLVSVLILDVLPDRDRRGVRADRVGVDWSGDVAQLQKAKQIRGGGDISQRARRACFTRMRASLYMY
jgi:hypothetical protein